MRITRQLLPQNRNFHHHKCQRACLEPCLMWTTAQPGPHKAPGLISTPEKCSPSASFTILGEHLCTRHAVSISSLWLAGHVESQSLPEQRQPAGHLSQLLPLPSQARECGVPTVLTALGGPRRQNVLGPLCTATSRPGGAAGHTR